MPEIPDLELYKDALTGRVVGQPLKEIRLKSPFLLRTAEPPITDLPGRNCLEIKRLAKRLVLCFEDDYYLLVHLMIAGRFQWRNESQAATGPIGLMAMDFESGTLLLTEASKKHRAALHLVRGEEGLAAFDPGGLEVAEIDASTFAERLQAENHTLKRTLTDQRIFAGIGNAYSDEILHAAGLSPLKQTSRLQADEIEKLYRACRQTLSHWTEQHREAWGEEFPSKVTAFHPGMAVHGRYQKPCPACQQPVQRIRYASNECNYCARCQNQDNILADRSLSRLLKKDWPKKLEDLE